MNRVAAPFVGSVCAVIALGSHVPVAHAETCAIVSGRGESRASPGAPWAPLAAGARTPSQGEIRTTSEPLRLCLTKDTSVELSPGTTIVLRGDARVAVDAVTRMTALDVALREGEIAIDASPSMWRGPLRKPVVVRGPGDVLALDWGGGTRARFLPARGSLPAGLLAASHRGDVMVSGQTTMRPIHAGFAVELRAGVVATPRPLASAPAWSADPGSRSPGPVAIVASNEARAIVAARFDPVAGALGYEAEIARDQAFTSVVERLSLGAAENAVVSPPLPVGRYFVRVGTRAIDGLPGLPGAPHPLRVVRVTLPNGGALLDGLAVLPPNRALRWEEPEGLEVAKGGGAFMRALPDLGLEGGDQQITARVRLAGDATYVPIVLTPQLFQATIDLGPKTATWPLDPVWITVRVTSPSEPMTLYEPVLRVTVNLREESVTWQRDRNVLRATLAPRTGRGPWTVRVEARDQRGKELGFGLLEVIGREVARRDP